MRRAPCARSGANTNREARVSGEERIHVAVYSRHLSEDRNLLVVLGDSAEVLAGKAAYDAHYGIQQSPGGAGAALERLIAAASLAAVSLAERESWGWTMTVAGSAYGLFCGAEPEGMVCGNTREAPCDGGIVYLQRKKGDGPLVESRFEPAPGDFAASVERYFLNVEQTETRIAIDGTDGALVQALPGGSLGDLATLEDGELVSQMKARRDSDRLEHLDDVAIFYECRCDDAVIRRMFGSMPRSSRAELWGDEERLQIACPRCGREFQLSRGEITFSETSGENVR
jgi:hypothetical protein